MDGATLDIVKSRLTIPLAKIAVSEGYRHFGLIFWQLAIGVVVLGTISAVRGKGIPLRMGDLRLYAVIALVGTVLPNSASFQAAVHLPAGVVSILIFHSTILHGIDVQSGVSVTSIWQFTRA